MTDFKKLQIWNWIVITLIIVSYTISLALKLYKIKNGTFRFGNSTLGLYVLWGLVTVIILFAAIFKIKGVMEMYPHLYQSQEMMKLHLILFSVNEVISLL